MVFLMYCIKYYKFYIRFFQALIDLRMLQNLNNYLLIIKVFPKLVVMTSNESIGKEQKPWA